MVVCVFEVGQTEIYIRDIAYRILLSTIVCDIAALLVLVVAISCLAFWRFWETIRVIYFIDDSLGVER